MFDDLRTQANTPEAKQQAEVEYESSSEREGMFMGMTAPQRFVIALFLLIMTCLLGSFCLVLTEKVVLPFF
jgi:hypothetical protein